MAKSNQVSRVRRKQDLADRYNIRLQGGKTGLVEATSRMDVSEFRVFATALTMILPEDEDFLEYEIKISDILKMFDLPSDGRYYDLFREAAMKILERKFIIFEKKEDGIEYKTTVPLIIETSEPVPVDEQNRIRIQFHPKLKPYLLQLKREYLTVDIRNLSELSSQYSVKMYLILKHQINLGNDTAKYDVSRLREILGIENHEYPSYGNFKQKVLVRAVKDINTYTDLRIPKFEELKRVRAIETIVFHLEHGTALQTEKYIQPTRQIVKSSTGKKIITSKIEIIGGETADNASNGVVEDAQVDPQMIDDLFEKVQKYKITKSTLKAWFDEVPQEQVMLGIRYVLEKIKNGEQIKNVAGYMRNMVYSPSLSEASQDDEMDKVRKLQVKEEKARQAAKEREIEAEKKAKNEIYNKYFKEQAQVAFSILEENPEIASEILVKMREDEGNPEVPFIKQITYSSFVQTQAKETIPEKKLVELVQNVTMTVLLYVVDELSETYGEEFKAVYEKHQKEAAKYGIELN